MHDFIVNCSVKGGYDPGHAASIARMLIYANEHGHFTHGTTRLHVYLRDLTTKTCSPKAQPKILKQKGGTALVDGDNALGSVVGELNMELAIGLENKTVSRMQQLHRKFGYCQKIKN